MDKNESLSESLDLRAIFIIIKKDFWKLLTWVLVGGFIAYLGTVFLITPKYTSNVDLLVNQKENNSQEQYTAQQADLQAINTYKDVLKKPVILDDVLKDAKKNDNYTGNLKELQDSIVINNETDSQVISVSVTDTNPYVAADIANYVGKVFDKKIKKMMKVNNVTIVTKATPETKPVSPSKGKNTLIGMIIGLAIGLTISIVALIKDTTVKGSEFLSEVVGITPLGTIYHIPNKDQKKMVVSVKTSKNNLNSNNNNTIQRHRL